MTTAITPHANTELIAVTWVNNVLGSAMAATTLPQDNTTWAASGFVLVTAVGGVRERHIPMVRPVVGLDIFMQPKKGTNKPPWGQCLSIAETLASACQGGKGNQFGRMTLPGGYPAARVMTVYVVREPYRVPDESGYARFHMELQFNWTTT